MRQTEAGSAVLAAAADAQQAATAAAVREAYKSGKLAFGFSAGGLLFPYYLGVAEELQRLGVMTPDSQLAGASAGSLIVACLKSGLPLATITEACFQLADDCRRNGTRHRLKLVLERVLREVLPQDIAQRCSGQVHVAVTRLTPGVTPRLVSRFSDREDLLGALLTSCHIPWYFDGSLFTSFRNTPCFDGGFTNFLPDVPGADATCRICCLPSKQLARIGNIAISPDAFAEWPYNLQQMLGWAFEPADEEQLRVLIECGKRDALAWVQQSGLAELAASSVLLNDSALDGGNGLGISLPESLVDVGSKSAVVGATTLQQQ
ncbi:hypothetical protein OEZ85_002415 [Tetradesmus obliquus]|uniref:Patatin n=1 Tax=Tetradesmus obliquus TaxID=3088 RepID=A0ABY8TXI3_TETOB|nr:hypothetical protein OEZ85_002415 [Tetradesmus obliquus]